MLLNCVFSKVKLVEQLSLALAVASQSFSSVKFPVPSHSTVMLDGQTILGFSQSSTNTSKQQFALLLPSETA